VGILEVAKIVAPAEVDIPITSVGSLSRLMLTDPVPDTISTAYDARLTVPSIY
jgi:hypothetical protein